MKLIEQRYDPKTYAEARVAIWFGIVVLMAWLMFRNSDGCVDWLSWTDNTYPNCRLFEIKDEGEYNWFGTIKATYDIEVRPGQYVCVKVESTNESYGWWVMAYYGHSWETGKPYHELRNWTAHGMLNFGGYPYWLVESGEWRCHQVPKMMRFRKDVPTPYILFKIHWCGFGMGGTVARPIVIVSDKDLGE